MKVLFCNIPKVLHISTLDPSALADCPSYYSSLSTVQGSTMLIYTAGQVGCDKHKATPTFLQRTSQSGIPVGAKPTDIVKLIYYTVNYSHKHRYHSEVLLEFLKGHRPPATLIPVPSLAKAEYLFEIVLSQPVVLGSMDKDAVTSKENHWS